MSKTISISQEGPANALALNKDFTQVVVAGRNVFKVFSIEDNEFSEVCNLRVGKNLNLNFSSMDVAWSMIEENTLATAATNGAVVVWNLGRSGRSKQEHVFFDHKRTVNKVSFHLSEPAILISGSQDGTMKCFDLRMKNVARTFFSNTESVRDVQFNPHAQQQFAAVSENGNVQLWDLRKPEKCFHQFTAHSGPVFACDWHPECNWLATASRDKTIKVWDIHGKPSLEYTIHTIASVGHVKWRPQRKFHIASCALVLDSSINIWDIRRPYIPFATFNEHKDVTTAVAWKGDPDIFLSTSRDCTLYRHMFKDASHPAMLANPQGISLSVKGDVVYSCRQSPPASISEKIQGFINRRQTPPQSEAETFYLARSVVRRWAGQPRRSFLTCARQYALSGKCLAALCDHNAKVARDAGKAQVSLVWCIIKTLYASKAASPDADANNTSTNVPATPACKGAEDGVGRGSMGGGSIGGTDGVAGECGSQAGGVSQTCDQRSLRSEHATMTNFSVVDDDTEAEEGGETQFLNNGVLGFPTHTIHIPKGPPPDLDANGQRKWLTARHAHYYDASAQDWTLQGEAFSPRPTATQCNLTDLPGSGTTHPQSSLQQGLQSETDLQNLEKGSSSSSQSLSHQNSSSSLTSVGQNGSGISSQNVTTVEDQPNSVLTVTSLPTLPSWDPTHIVVDALKMHAELGDVQTAASVLLALGDLRNTLNAYLDEVTQEQWLVGYLELLARHKLWDICTQVIQGAWISSIAQLNQQSTVMHTSCGKCGKQLARAGWLCDKCNSSQPAQCCICHQIVKGLYAWCQGCSHGGHVLHMQEWMSKHKQCPTGCGHMCEYS